MSDLESLNPLPGFCQEDVDDRPSKPSWSGAHAGTSPRLPKSEGEGARESDR